MLTCCPAASDSNVHSRWTRAPRSQALSSFLSTTTATTTYSFLATVFYYCRLQKFKLNIANTVISQDNSSLSTMDTGQLLDLFSVDKEKRKEKTPAQQQSEGGKTSLKAMMENLGELWDEEQYETEYNLDKFIGSLK